MFAPCVLKCVVTASDSGMYLLLSLSCEVKVLSGFDACFLGQTLESSHPFVFVTFAQVCALCGDSACTLKSNRGFDINWVSSQTSLVSYAKWSTISWRSYEIERVLP